MVMNGFTSDFKFLLIAYVFQIFYAELVSPAIKKLKKQILETKIIKFLIAGKEETKSMGDLVQSWSWEGYVQALGGLHLI